MMLSQTRPAAARLHYAWVILALSFATVVVTAGVRATPSVLIVPLEAEFHWSRATISFAVSVNLLLFGAIGPFAAAAMDRFGARRTMILALAATAAGVALTPAMHQPWQLVMLWGVVVGLATGFVGGYFAAFIAARWFQQRAGLVVGVLTAANAAGQLVFLPTMAELATNAGWRVMSFALAGTVVAFLPLLALLMRDRPEDLGLARYGEEPRPKATAAPDGNPIVVAFRALATGARSRDFWLIAGGYFVCGATTNGLIGTHLIAACVDHGLSEVAGAGLLAATGVFALLGGTIAGWLSDHCDNRLLLCAYYGLRGLALLYLPFAFAMPFYGLSAFSVVYGLDWIASAPPTVRLLIGVVGAERIGIMVAWITVIHQIGSASAAYLAGLLRLDFGTYLQAFLLSGTLLLGAAVMVLFIGAGRGGHEREISPAAA
ncbi:MAG TPA: MFS transporter [Stellaceae bacterium]|nr:MFS transporter [Stellaceae bacterium]